MSSDLRDTFITLARMTSHNLEVCRSINHQIQEETITDLNLFHLKLWHPHDIYSYTYNKREEGRNGADWEWWLTDFDQKKWLGIRVQAKVLKLKTNCFEHLHHKPNKSSIYQLEKLVRECANEIPPRTPLYCFYLNTDYNPVQKDFRLKLLREHFGCSIASTDAIQKLQKNKINDLNSVLAIARPWHQLICSTDGSDLLTSAKQFLEKLYGSNKNVNISNQKPDLGPSIDFSRSIDFSFDNQNDKHLVQFVDSPPNYVRAIMKNEEPDEEMPESVRSVLVVIDSAPESS